MRDRGPQSTVVCHMLAACLAASFSWARAESTCSADSCPWAGAESTPCDDLGWQGPYRKLTSVSAQNMGYAGNVGLFLCAGIHNQNRSFDSIWNTELAPVQGPFHKRFAQNAILSPGSYAFFNQGVKTSYRQWSVDLGNLARLINVDTFRLSYNYTGRDFGSQQIIPDREVFQPVYKDDGLPVKPHTFPIATQDSSGAFPGVDYERIAETVDKWFKDSIYATYAVTVIYQGKLVLERYAADREIKRDTPLLSASVCKSIANAFLGLRIADGAMRLTDLTRAPGWDDAEVARRNITIAQLSRMVDGFDTNDEDVAAMASIVSEWSSPAYAGTIKQKYPPGEFWDYKSVAVELLSYNFRLSFQQKRSQESTPSTGDVEYWSYLRNRLFKKIGITSMITNPDASGTLQYTGKCFATALDFARFGQLYLQNGTWDGEQIIPREWIAYSLTPTAANRTPYQRGDGWWLNPYPGVTPPDHFAAQGVHGQWIGVIPSKQLVITHHGFAEFVSTRGKAGEYFGNITASFP